MSLELKVHPSFFKEFATKTWTSPYDILRELIENAFDEDATTVIITILSNGNVVIEDNAGMDFESIKKFLILGTPHKSDETLSPKLKRIRTGRYGTGRLSFLTSFDNMKIKTKLQEFDKTFIIDSEIIENLAKGHTKLNELSEPPLNRNGTEIFLNNSKIFIDATKLLKELKKLSILKYPLFEVYIKNSDVFKEWDLNGTQIVRSPDVQGYKILVNIFNPDISGEIIIAKRPLSSDEKGIAIMVGNHMVLRSTFGFDNKLNRVTGFVKCDQLTSRFADKSALIENDVYFKFNRSMKEFIVDKVFPSLTEYEDVLITREESKIYKEIDKVMGQAVIEMLQIDEEVQGFESVEITSIENNKVNLPRTDQIFQKQEGEKQQKVREESFIIDNVSSIKEQRRFASLQGLKNLDKINEYNDHYHHNLTSEYETGQLSLKSDDLNEEEYSIYHDQNNIKGIKENNSNFNNNNNSENIYSYNKEEDYTNNHDSKFNNSINKIKEDTDFLDSEENNHFGKNKSNTHIDINNYDSGSPVIRSCMNTNGFNKKISSQSTIDSSTHNHHVQEYTNTKTAATVTATATTTNTTNDTAASYVDKLSNQQIFIKKTIRKPVLKKTFALKKIGYKVIPYEDETDSRYSFTNDNIVFVNKAHSTYKAESERGDEFLFRHITNIVAEVVVGSKYPEARDILEIQNKLISEAIKIHDYSLLKK